MSNIFAISDLHFDHARIIELCHRPFSSKEEMNEQMVSRWNSVVSNEDHVIFGGDFMFAKEDKWFDRLNGRKTLVVGNHDHSRTINLGWFNVFTRRSEEHTSELQSPLNLV